MKYIVFSDMHDYTGWLKRIPEERELGYICLGDICERNADAARRNMDILMRLRNTGKKFFCVYGTHDRPIVSDSEWDGLGKWKKMIKKAKKENWENRDEAIGFFQRFYEDAKRLRKELEPEYLDFLESLNSQEFVSENGKLAQFIHSYLPVHSRVKRRMFGTRDFKIINKETAETQFSSPKLLGDYLFVGHSHQPLAFFKNPERIIQGSLFQESCVINLSDTDKYILGPGSVWNMKSAHGAAGARVYRSNKMGSYGIWDTERNTFEVVVFGND